MISGHLVLDIPVGREVAQHIVDVGNLPAGLHEALTQIVEPARTIVVEGAVGQRINDPLEARYILVMPTRIVVPLEGRQLLLSGTKNVGVVVTYRVEDLDVGPIQGAQGESAVHHKLHIRSTRGLLAGHRNLLGDVSGRNDVLGRGDVVVVNKDDLDPTVDVLVVIDQTSHLVDEFDNRLSTDVTGSGLSAKDENPLRNVEAHVVLDAKVEVEHIEGVEQLTLVLVQSLDLDVKNSVRINLDALTLGYPSREVDLVSVFDLVDAVVDRLIHGISVVSEH